MRKVIGVSLAVTVGLHKGRPHLGPYQPLSGNLKPPCEARSRRGALSRTDAKCPVETRAIGTSACMRIIVGSGQKHPKEGELAFPPAAADIGPGRLAVDEPLANRVRSGRKQP